MKLYYEDPYLKEINTKFLRQETDEHNRHYVILQDTILYPEGGGQPCDYGYINGIKVTDVQEINDEIRHYIKEKLPIETTEVGVILDWERRFDHMQQHIGQHLLTAILADVHGIDTLGFYLGKETVTIDLNTREWTESISEQVELHVNQRIFNNNPIETKWINQDEISTYPLRKTPTVKSDIRLVIIQGLDYNACGGTHPKALGEIGYLKILSWEKYKGGIRLYFVCGARAVKQMVHTYSTLRNIAQELNTNEGQVLDKFNKVLNKTTDLERELKETTEKIALYKAKEYIANGRLVNDHLLITDVMKEGDFKQIQDLGQMIVKDCNHAVVFFILESDTKLQIAALTGNNGDLNMNIILKELLPIINGKGGGTSNRAQGGGEKIIDPLLLVEKFEHTIQGL